MAAGTRGPAPVQLLEQRITVLEGEIDDLSRSIGGMRDELQFMQRLLEDPKKKQP